MMEGKIGSELIHVNQARTSLDLECRTTLSQNKYNDDDDTFPKRMEFKWR